MRTWKIKRIGEVAPPVPVTSLKLAVVAGAVQVSACEGAARVRVLAVTGPPLEITQRDGELTVAHGRRAFRCSADLEVAVPPDCPVDVQVVSAAATLTGTGPFSTVRSTSGHVRVCGARGTLAVESVSGALTVLGNALSDVSAVTTSGILDLTVARGCRVAGRTLSGPATLRIGRDADARFDLRSGSGRIEVPADRPFGGADDGRATCTVGAGAAVVAMESTSGDIRVVE